MADENKAYASIQISFGEDEAGGDADANKSITIELDEVANNGKTTFEFGEKANLRIFTFPENMVLENAESTDGTPSGPAGTGTVTIEDEQVTFTNSDSASPSKPVMGGTLSYEWLGKSLGTISLQEDGTLKVPNKGTGVALISYTSRFRKASLVLPPRDEPIPYNVIVWVTEA